MNWNSASSRVIVAAVIICTNLIVGSRVSRGQWVPTNGPTGGDVTSFASLGKFLFAGTHGRGVFRTTDQGNQWISIGPGSANVLSMATLDTDIFVATDQGLFRTSALATNWTRIDSNLGYSNFPFLCVADSLLFTATNAGGLFVSSDRGQDWRSVSTGLPALPIINCLAANNTTLIAGILHYGIYVSTDAGQTWHAANGALSKYSVVDFVAVQDTTLFAKTADSELIRSTNSGASWAKCMAPSEIDGIVTLGSEVFVLTTGGVERSSNSGTTWRSLSISPGLSPIHALIRFGKLLFAGDGSQGVLLSSDSGSTWNAANTGITNTAIYDLSAVDSGLFASGSSGEFYTSDDGNAWEDPTPPLPVSSAMTVAQLGTNRFMLPGLLRSTDNGKSWNDQLPPPDMASWSGINCLLVVSGNIYLGTDDGVFVTGDTGSTWRRIANGLADSGVTCVAGDASRLFVTLKNGEGIYSSMDGGDNWSSVPTPIALDYATALAVDSSNLFVACVAGIYLTTNFGRSWGLVNQGLADSNILSLATLNGDLFAGTSSYGVWRRPISEMIVTSAVQSSQHTTTPEVSVYPNPAAGTCAIRFAVSESGRTRIMLDNMLGETVKHVFDGYLTAGTHVIPLITSPLRPGDYECVIQSGKQVQQEKIIVAPF